MRKAMIVWGGWPGHDPDLCASMIRGWLKEEGFDVRVETSTAAFADPAIHDLSLIVPIYTMSKIEKPEALNLCAAVRGGVGLAGHHGGMCDAFRDSVDYQFMCGGQWVAHPGNIIDYKVDVTKPDDPIMAGASAVSSTAPSSITCMSIRRTRCWRPRPSTGEHAPWIEGVVMPVVWKKRYGEGRVFYSSLGHRAYELDVPEIRTMMTARPAVGGALMAKASQFALDARRSKTSRATRAFRWRPSTAWSTGARGVREKTIARVEAAVAKLGYRADPAAARLARNQSFRFAFILPTGSNSFMTEPRRAGRAHGGMARPASAPSSTSCMSTCSIRTRWRARWSRSRPPITASPRSRSIIRACAPRSTISPRAALRW